MIGLRTTALVLLVLLPACVGPVADEERDDEMQEALSIETAAEPVGEALDALTRKPATPTSKDAIMTSEQAHALYQGKLRPKWKVYRAEPHPIANWQRLPDYDAARDSEGIVAVPQDGRGHPIYLSLGLLRYHGDRYLRPYISRHELSLLDLLVIAQELEAAGDALPMIPHRGRDSGCLGFECGGPPSGPSWPGEPSHAGEGGPPAAQPGAGSTSSESGPIQGETPSRWNGAWSVAKNVSVYLEDLAMRLATHSKELVKHASDVTATAREELRGAAKSHPKTTTFTCDISCTLFLMKAADAGAVICKAIPAARAFGDGIPCTVTDLAASTVGNLAESFICVDLYCPYFKEDLGIK